jgi:hypothetical protein
MSIPYSGVSTDANTPAISGQNDTGSAIVGTSHSGLGVWGSSQSSNGVGGESDTAIGVHGVSKGAGQGIRGDSETGIGVFGRSNAPDGTGGQAGVVGDFPNGTGVFGSSVVATGVGGTTTSGVGVHGDCPAPGTGGGVKGTSHAGVGVWAESQEYEGVHAVSNSASTAAIAAYQTNPNSTGAAIYAKREPFPNGSPGAAGVFDGNVHVSNNLFVKGDVLLEGADFAEDFAIGTSEDSSEPGTVMVLADNERLYECARPYDKRVAGVIAGAVGYRPGIIMDKQENGQNRKPIALLGKTYCKVDATFGPIEIGDLLTSSSTPGHAMKASDQSRAFGATIGKAMKSVREGTALIPILIALQ